jgi:antiviral helicase SKI2
VNYIDNTFSQVSRPLTALSVARKGYDGTVVGFKETILDDATLTSNNSTSFTRAFGSTKDFVRGSATQFPFAPGGLDVEVDMDELDKMDLNVEIDFDNGNQVVLFSL